MEEGSTEVGEKPLVVPAAEKEAAAAGDEDGNESLSESDDESEDDEEGGLSAEDAKERLEAKKEKVRFASSLLAWDCVWCCYRQCAHLMVA